jgi:hypothetical protein
MTYGSIQNRISENYGQNQFDDIEIGMGGTKYLWSDRSAVTVVKKLENGIIGITYDESERTDNNDWSESQEYEYTTDWDSEPIWMKKDRSGRWCAVRKNEKTGRWNKYDNIKVSFGHRETYRDPSF